LRLIPREGGGLSCDPDGSDCGPASTSACSPTFERLLADLRLMD
jgi:hypothetical protein